MSIGYIRAELHNHSTESDGSLSVKELVSYGEQKGFQVMAITDHNTASGQDKALYEARNKKIEILPGIEITTFYGHILALGLRRMVDFADLDVNSPEKFIRKLKEAGARAVGMAHPFCVGEPVMVGCRMSLKLRYPEILDYIEVFNTSGGDLFSGNKQALEWWESLVLQGIPVAAVTGIDLHSLPVKQHVFTTYAIDDREEPEKEKVSKAELVLRAILRQKTIVTKGPLFASRLEHGILKVQFEKVGHDGYVMKGENQDWPEDQDFDWLETEDLFLYVRENTGMEHKIRISGQESLGIPVSCRMKSAYLELYQGEKSEKNFKNLVAVGAPVYGEETR